jgi:hypothetical protein
MHTHKNLPVLASLAEQSSLALCCQRFCTIALSSFDCRLFALRFSGILMVNVESFPTALCTVMVPPWASTIRLQMASMVSTLSDRDEVRCVSAGTTLCRYPMTTLT